MSKTRFSFAATSGSALDFRGHLTEWPGWREVRRLLLRGAGWGQQEGGGSCLVRILVPRVKDGAATALSRHAPSTMVFFFILEWSPLCGGGPWFLETLSPRETTAWRLADKGWWGP